MLAFVVLAACAKQENSELNWARAALERNPQVKVLAVDAEKNTIQVRVKATGETLTVTPGELAAIPLGDLIVLASAPRQVPRVAEPTPEPAQVAEPLPPEPVTTPAEPAKPEYTVQREDGRVRVTGPGVSIETHKPAQEMVAVTQAFDEPIICDGKRMLHIDNKRINVSGDAIVARGGCELHITNSRIYASGTGVTVLDANVHIVNSEVTGTEGSLTTSSAAHVLLHNSQFTGLARRDNQASIQDQGGNTWR
jgi:hypothetical protein